MRSFCGGSFTRPLTSSLLAEVISSRCQRQLATNVQADSSRWCLTVNNIFTHQALAMLECYTRRSCRSSIEQKWLSQQVRQVFPSIAENFNYWANWLINDHSYRLVAGYADWRQLVITAAAPACTEPPYLWSRPPYNFQHYPESHWQYDQKVRFLLADNLDALRALLSTWLLKHLSKRARHSHRFTATWSAAYIYRHCRIELMQLANRWCRRYGVSARIISPSVMAEVLTALLTSDELPMLLDHGYNTSNQFISVAPKAQSGSLQVKMRASLGSI